MQQAKEQGWPVLCHQPFTDVADEARRQFAEAHRIGWPLMVAPLERIVCAPALAAVETAGFGEVAQVTAFWEALDAPDKASARQLLIRLLLLSVPFFHGEDPLLVSADWRHEVSWARLEFRGGRELTAEIVPTERSEDAIRIAVTGDGTELELTEEVLRWRTGAGPWLPVDDFQAGDGAYTLILGRALVRLDGGPSWDADTVQQVALLEAIQRSYEHGGGAVPLP